MNTKSKIREALKKFMTTGEANACNIFKGYEMSTGKTGWHYVPFNGQAVYLGNNERDALEMVEEIADSRFEA